VTSELAWSEAERNVKRKMKGDAIERLEGYRTTISLVSIETDDVEGEDIDLSVINEKDQHIIQAATSAFCQHLVTLDRGLLAEVVNSDLSLQARLPVDFIKQVMRPLVNDEKPTTGEYAQLEDTPDPPLDTPSQTGYN